MQTTTPLSLLTLPSKDALVQEFVGRDIRTLRTPALIVDRNQFRRNCERVTGETERRGMGFRAHVKSECRVTSRRRGARRQSFRAGGEVRRGRRAECISRKGGR
jgi:hypothetical protein